MKMTEQKIYNYWNKAEIVKPYIKDFLKKKFLNNLIVSEFNKIDLLVLDENLPVEVQSTVIVDKDNHVNHALFEDKIRRQIEDNIVNYGKCWFFFDSEYYRYLKETTRIQISMNLDWFAKYVKEEKLIVFIISYNGLIKELKYDDLEFIKRLSNTCNIECNDDSRVLNRNKLNIMSSVLKGYKFIQYEIDDIEKCFIERKLDGNNEKSLRDFLQKESDERKNVYGNVLHSLGNLDSLNNVLNMNEDFTHESKTFGMFLGVFRISNKKHDYEFIDNFNICKHFPGYVRHKEAWDAVKGTVFSPRGLRNYFWTKNTQAKTLMDF